MKNDLMHNVASLQSKVEKLVFLHQKALEDNLKIQALADSLNAQLEEQNRVIENLIVKSKQVKEEEIQRITQSTNEVVMSFEQIDALVRDVDKCLTLLSIEKRKQELV